MDVLHYMWHLHHEHQVDGRAATAMLLLWAVRLLCLRLSQRLSWVRWWRILSLLARILFYLVIVPSVGLLLLGCTESYFAYSNLLGVITGIILTEGLLDHLWTRLDHGSLAVLKILCQLPRYSAVSITSIPPAIAVPSLGGTWAHSDVAVVKLVDAPKPWFDKCLIMDGLWARSVDNYAQLYGLDSGIGADLSEGTELMDAAAVGDEVLWAKAFSLICTKRLLAMLSADLLRDLAGAALTSSSRDERFSDSHGSGEWNGQISARWRVPDATVSKLASQLGARFSNLKEVVETLSSEETSCSTAQVIIALAWLNVRSKTMDLLRHVLHVIEELHDIGWCGSRALLETHIRHKLVVPRHQFRPQNDDIMWIQINGEKLIQLKQELKKEKVPPVRLISRAQPAASPWATYVAIIKRFARSNSVQPHLTQLQDIHIRTD